MPNAKRPAPQRVNEISKGSAFFGGGLLRYFKISNICFSLENSEFIWKAYANGSAFGKVCVVFDFDKLRAKLNDLWREENSKLEYNGILCHQIFSINYGIVEYVDWCNYQTNQIRLPNPIAYTYLKDEKFREEKEFRISLSALGIGNFVLNDASSLQFSTSVQISFDFRAAISDGTISELLCDNELLKAELARLFPNVSPDPFQSLEQS